MSEIINTTLNTSPNLGVVSHKESINHTPVSNCEWKTFLGTEGERGISRCYPTDKERIDILNKYRTEYIKYNINGEPDFSPFIETQIKISDMSDIRLGSKGNFRSASKKIVGSKWAKEKGLNSIKEIEKYIDENKLTWHEKRDGVTMELIPREVHEKFPHLGGVSVMSQIINKDGATVGKVIIRTNQSLVEIQEIINDRTEVVKNVISEYTGQFMSENFKQINAAGVDEAVNSALFAATFSTVTNISSVIKNEKNGKDAIKEILYDTASAAVLGYSRRTVMENYSISQDAAILLVNGTVQISKQILYYANGKIDEKQLLSNVAETTVNVAVAYVGKIIGRNIIPIPFVGSYIGEMITTAICSEIITTIKSTKEFEKQNKKYISLYHRAEREIRASNERLTSIIESENNELKAIIQEGFNDIYNGMQENSYDMIIKGLGVIGLKFGIDEEELKKDCVTRENIFKNRNKVITIGKDV